MRILVTGASGFIGRALLERLSLRREFAVVAAVRGKVLNPVRQAEYFEVGDLSTVSSWREVLIDVDVVIHTAARAHHMNESVSRSFPEYRQVNVLGTLNLARQAGAFGVRRFVFMSSIKVNGERTAPGNAFSADDAPAPEDAYGVSKYEAEVQLQKLSQHCGMEIVCIRPPLVYGPGVKANFHTVMRWVDRGWPVPVGSVNNRRSFVALDNLLDMIETCALHPAAANQVFTVSDGEDISTRELVCRIGVAFDKPVRFIRVPVGLLRLGAGLAGKRSQVERLLNSLQVDIEKTRRLLGWSPVIAMDRALEVTAQSYLMAAHR